MFDGKKFEAIDAKFTELEKAVQGVVDQNYVTVSSLTARDSAAEQRVDAAREALKTEVYRTIDEKVAQQAAQMTADTQAQVDAIRTETAQQLAEFKAETTGQLEEILESRFYQFMSRKPETPDVQDTPTGQKMDAIQARALQEYALTKAKVIKDLLETGISRNHVEPSRFSLDFRGCTENRRTWEPDACTNNYDLLDALYIYGDSAILSSDEELAQALPKENDQELDQDHKEKVARELRDVSRHFKNLPVAAKFDYIKTDKVIASGGKRSDAFHKLGCIVLNITASDVSLAEKLSHDSVEFYRAGAVHYFRDNVKSGDLEKASRIFQKICVGQPRDAYTEMMLDTMVQTSEEKQHTAHVFNEMVEAYRTTPVHEQYEMDLATEQPTKAKGDDEKCLKI